MDKDRQIRMLIPPFFLIAAVLWGAYLSGDLYGYLHSAQASDSAASLKSVLSILAVGGVATLPIGYAIGILTILFLKLFALLGLFPHRAYDVPISKQALQKIWQKLRVPEGAKKTPLCAASLFEFVLLRPQVHSWLFRRWTSFNISTQCAMAMLSSCLVAKAICIRPPCEWWLTIMFFVCVFIVHAIISWREVYHMINLAVDLPVTMRPKAVSDAD
jgi:hypothetical protein